MRDFIERIKWVTLKSRVVYGMKPMPENSGLKKHERRKSFVRVWVECFLWEFKCIR